MISQQKRDDMLKHALEDNRKLKELNIMYERTMKLYMGNTKKSSKKLQHLPPIGIPKASMMKESADNKSKIAVNCSLLFLIKSSLQVKTKVQCKEKGEILCQGCSRTKAKNQFYLLQFQIQR